VKMQRFESQIESLQYQLLYGDSIKDKEIQVLQRKLDALNGGRQSTVNVHNDTTAFDDLSHEQMLEVLVELQGELGSVYSKHQQTLRQLHLLSQQLRDTQNELSAAKQQESAVQPAAQLDSNNDNHSSSEYNKTLKFDAQTTELLRLNSNNYTTNAPELPTATPDSVTDSKTAPTDRSSMHMPGAVHQWLNQTVLIASSVSVLFGMTLATIFK